MLQLIERLPPVWQTAVRGALAGDALGVPHEFKASHALPRPGTIRMVMPGDYAKTYDRVPYGTWSDDGSQMLALLEALHHGRGVLSLPRFTENLLAWYRRGHFQAGGVVFDCGGQTRAALESIAAGREFDIETESTHCGNGSLMRVLPIAAMPDAYGVSRDDAIATALSQSCVTHPQWLGQVCCALYVELCWLLQDGWVPAMSTLHAAGEVLRARNLLPREGVKALAMVIGHGSQNLPNGSGYVVSTLWAALWAVSNSRTHSEALRRAVALGDDTDTIACVAGGLAALAYGLDATTREWLTQMTFEAARQ